METQIWRYSRILVTLPPSQKIKEEVKRLVEETFRIIPEYIITPWFEGYAISWRAWYGFDSLKYPNFRHMFPSRIKQILEDFLEEEEIGIVEFIDETLWNWLDPIKDFDEIFNGNYWKSRTETITHVTLNSDSLRVKMKSGNHVLRYVFIQNIPELMKQEYKEIWPILKKICRRGYWNITEQVIDQKLKQKLYDRVGFRFGETF